MVSPRRQSAVFELDLVRFGGPTTSRTRYKNIGTGVTELLAANADRVMYWITNNGPSLIYWTDEGNPSATAGHQLGSGSVLIIRAYDDGDFVTRRLNAVANSAASDVTITEVWRAHRGG